MTSVIQNDLNRGRQLETPESENPITKCDFTFCAPKFCQQLRQRRLVAFWLSWSSFTQTMLFTGFLKSSITAIEKRFNMSSKEAGAIVSFYNVGNVLALLPVSYYGGQMRRLRVLSCGMFIIGLASFLMALPHVTTGDYKYQASTVPLCLKNRNNPYANICGKEDKKQSLNAYKYLFWLAFILVGIGTSPIYTAGISYIDDNNTKKDSAFYIAMLYGCSVLGPAIGFIMASKFLQIYVDIGKSHPGLSREDTTRWVGAWWLGFFIAGFMCITAVVPLYGFPKELPGTDEIRAKKISEAYGSSEEMSRELDFTLEQLFKNLKLMFKNPTYLCLCFAATFEDMLITGISTFAPKFLETVFGMSSQKASLSFGAVIVPSGTLGVHFGGFVINRLQLSLPHILRFETCVVSSILPLLLLFLVPCGLVGKDVGWAGVTMPFDNKSTAQGLDHACNKGCNCLTNRALYYPICLSNELSYYSPCYAGCSISDDYNERTCSCIKSRGKGATFKSGPCLRKCRYAPIFLFLLGVTIFLVFTLTTPTVSATIRCLPAKQKTLGLGLQWLIVRTFGSIPGAIIAGALFDSACALQSKTCNDDVQCTLYYPKLLQKYIMAFAYSAKVPVACFVSLAWMFYKPTENADEATTNESIQTVEQLVKFDSTDAGNKAPPDGKAAPPDTESGTRKTSNIPESEIGASYAAVLSAMPPQFRFKRGKRNSKLVTNDT